MAQRSANPEEVYNQKSDIGCSICWKTSVTAHNGAATGVKLKSCSTCNGPRLYCSTQCFQIDWNTYNHKDECRRLAAEVNFDDLEAEAERLELLKIEANKLYVAQNYEEAILLYQDVKIGAIHLLKAAKNRRMKEYARESSVVELPDYLKMADGLVSETDLKICFKPDNMECGVSRLAAIAANNAAIAYIKLKNSIQAAACSREALRLDPLFAYRILPRLLDALELGVTSDNGSIDENHERSSVFLEMASRIMNFIECQVETNECVTCCTQLFDRRLISYKEFSRKSDQFFFAIIFKDKQDISKRLKQPEEVLFRPYDTGSAPFKIGVSISIIPYHEAHWITIGHKDVENPMSFMVGVTYQSLRVRPVDLRGDPDSVDAKKCHPQGSLSHIGSLTAIKNAHREIVLYVNDLEREGLQVSQLTLGCGLFDLLPKDMDPQKSQRKPARKTDKYVLYPGHYLPPHTKIIPSLSHIKLDRYRVWVEKVLAEISSS